MTRRSFLSAITACLAALGIAPKVEPTPTPPRYPLIYPDNMMGVGPPLTEADMVRAMTLRPRLYLQNVTFKRNGRVVSSRNRTR